MTPLARARRRLAELTPGEWLLLPQLAGLALLLGGAARLLPLPRLLALLGRAAASPRLRALPVGQARADLDRLERLADLAARVAPGTGRCLVRSLLLYWLLATRGRPPGLVIGVSRAAGSLDGHAWIEADGRVVGDRPEAVGRYAVVARL